MKEQMTVEYELTYSEYWSGGGHGNPWSHGKKSFHIPKDHPNPDAGAISQAESFVRVNPKIDSATLSRVVKRLRIGPRVSGKLL